MTSACICFTPASAARRRLVATGEQLYLHVDSAAGKAAPMDRSRARQARADPRRAGRHRRPPAQAGRHVGLSRPETTAMPKIVDHEQRRDEIALVACRVVAEYGFDQATDRAHRARGRLYHRHGGALLRYQAGHHHRGVAADPAPYRGAADAARRAGGSRICCRFLPRRCRSTSSAIPSARSGPPSGARCRPTSG